ncbi:MAG: hypothetical protein ACYC35_00125 [Pirellulales bacterium]
MLKSVSFGIGIFLLVLGLSLHTVDSYTVRPSVAAQATGVWGGPFQPTAKSVVPEPWKPWAYAGGGIILILWTCTLPARMKGK